MTTKVPFALLDASLIADEDDVIAGAGDKIVTAERLKESLAEVSSPSIIKGEYSLSSFHANAGIGNEAADTAALTAALQSGEQAVTVDAVEFKIAAGRYVIQPGTAIKGASKVNSRLHMQDTTWGDGVLIIPAGGSNVSVENLTLKGPWAGVGGSYRAGQSAIEGEGTEANPVSHVSVRNVIIDGFGDNGVRMAWARHCRINKNELRNIGRTGVQYLSGYDVTANLNTIRNIAPGAGGNAPNLNAYGIAFTLANAASEPTRLFEAIGNLIDGVPSWEGIDTHAGEDGVIALNRIYNTYLGIVLMAAGSGAVYPHAATRISVIGNRIHRRNNALVPNVRAGILVTPWSSVNGGDKARDIEVIGNWVRNMGGTADVEGAISAYNTFGITISDNILSDVHGHGIETGIDVYGTVQNNHISSVIPVSGVARYYAFMHASCMLSVNGNTAYRRGDSPTAAYFINSPATGELGVRINADNKALGFSGFTVLSTSSFNNRHPDSNWQ